MSNPQLAIQPQLGIMFVNDGGADASEEIDQAVKGANYGWPATEGTMTAEGIESPLHSYGDAQGCEISGGAFHSLLKAQFPAGYWAGYFFGDRCAGWIRFRTANGDLFGFASGIPQPMDLKMSDDGSLYYLARGVGDTTGMVSRITFDPARPNIDLKTTEGGDEAVFLNPTDALTMTWSFDAGDAGLLDPAELYIGVFTPMGGPLWFDPAIGFTHTITPAYAGALPSFGTSMLLSAPHVGETLLPGGYLWFVLVDKKVDGIPTGEVSDMVLTVVAK